MPGRRQTGLETQRLTKLKVNSEALYLITVSSARDRLGHRDYVHEPEAYEALQDLYAEASAAEPSADEFYFGLFTGSRPAVLEAPGSTLQRLRTLEEA